MQPLAGSGFVSLIGVPSRTRYWMFPFDPKYSFNVENTLLCWPLAAATPPR